MKWYDTDELKLIENRWIYSITFIEESSKGTLTRRFMQDYIKGEYESGVFSTQTLYIVLILWIFLIQVLSMNGASSNLKTNAIASFYSLLLQYVIIFITYVFKRVFLRITSKFQHLYILWSILITVGRTTAAFLLIFAVVHLSRHLDSA